MLGSCVGKGIRAGKTPSAPRPSTELREFHPTVQMGHQRSRDGVSLSKATQSAETTTSTLPQGLLGRQAESMLLRTLAWARVSPGILKKVRSRE